MRAKKPEGSTYPPISAGTHQAVIYGIVEEGTQYSERFNKSSPKVLIMWELPKVRIDIEKEGEPAKNVPRVTSREYTLSLHEKSNFSKDCLSLRGSGFSPEEIKAGYNPFDLMGINCLLQIVHVRKDEKVYANISSIVNLPIDMEPIEAESDRIYYDMDEHGFNFPDNLHSWLIDIIKQSGEYKEYSQSISQDHRETGQDHPDSVDDDDIPF